MNSNHTVSIIVPVYNTGEKKLKRCVNSLTAQSYADIRIILVDDGSTDHTDTVCDEIKNQDHRITVIHQDNKGSIEARKTGLLSKETQTCGYVMFCDSDDTMPENAVKTLISYATQNDADCVCGQSKSIKGTIQYVTKRDCFMGG